MLALHPERPVPNLPVCSWRRCPHWPQRGEPEHVTQPPLSIRPSSSSSGEQVAPHIRHTATTRRSTSTSSFLNARHFVRMTAATGRAPRDRKARTPRLVAALMFLHGHEAGPCFGWEPHPLTV